jgi:glycosyltransferase involved in cell wall biosynthesis
VIADVIQNQNPELTSKIKIIPNPLPRDFSISNIMTLNKDDPLILLYVGRIHPEKGLDLLLNAYMKFSKKSSKPTLLRIIGPHLSSLGGAGEAYLSKLKKITDQRCPTEWLGPIFDSEKLQHYYEQASFLVYPSIAAKGEASPLTPVEAMAKGCIPILSNLDCFNDYLQPGYNGFSFDLQNGDPVDNLVAVFKKTTEIFDSLEDMKKACLDTARYFLPGIIAEQYLSDFKTLLKS